MLGVDDVTCVDFKSQGRTSRNAWDQEKVVFHGSGVYPTRRGHPVTTMLLVTSGSKRLKP